MESGHSKLADETTPTEQHNPQNDPKNTGTSESEKRNTNTEGIDVDLVDPLYSPSGGSTRGELPPESILSESSSSSSSSSSSDSDSDSSSTGSESSGTKRRVKRALAKIFSKKSRTRTSGKAEKRRKNRKKRHRKSSGRKRTRPHRIRKQSPKIPRQLRHRRPWRLRPST